MKLFGKEEVNTGRQFELDLAKAVCILGMVMVHCFEEFPISGTTEESLAYYITVIILDAVFGAGTFMGCMGIGMTYSTKNTPEKLMKRGLHIFLLAYILNILRYCIPYLSDYFRGEATFHYIVLLFFSTDILQFAGLSLFLFGFLKKIKLPDWGILIIAVAMSVCGSFFRFVEIENRIWAQIAGLFLNTTLVYNDALYIGGFFPLLNWFLVVVLGFFYGKALRRCTNPNRYYAIALPVSALILGIYIPIAITQGIGMLSGEIIYYYALTTPEVLILLVGMIFATSLYHFIAKLMGNRVKSIITRISTLINDVYCIHWIIIGITEVILWTFLEEGLSSWLIFAISLVIFIVSVFLADWYKKAKEKAKAKRA